MDPMRTAAINTKKKGGIWPALALFMTAPLVAEFLLGNLPIKLLPALIVLAPLYGGGALLIREWVRRTGRGWPSILLLGMAYAIVEEAYTTQSLFNPDYLKLHLELLTPAYISALGIGGWWTLWMLNVHAIWSIATPIALIEACVPNRSQTPWLGRIGMSIVTLFFIFGAVASTTIQVKQDQFLASRTQFAVAALVIVLLVVAAFLLPPGRRTAAQGKAPSPWIVGAVALLFGSATLLVPQAWGWGAVAELLALDVIMLLAVIAWSRRAGWGLVHQLALSAGAALAYGWHAFLQHPAVGNLDSSVRIGNAIFLAGALGLIWFAAARVSAGTTQAAYH
ncbi:hypothetical protein [Occallatibacter savannae]|uniref:hypothetical protein n=1 Tax=Occallatibacter savannae TaxID=1002691 RepID=UPI0013A569B5|nr:hypothetical protein [Occallatibacter savannae]